MKKCLKQILKYYLKYITKIVLFVHRPTIIVIAGSINKPFVKEEVKRILKKEKYKVRANPKNFNTEIGLPLAVLSLPSGYNSFKDWLPAIYLAPLRLFQKSFPKFLVLSLGTSDPGDIKYLLSIIKPKIAVITDVTQRYLESFDNVDNLFKEYIQLAKIIPKNGLLITNNDNVRLKTLKNHSKAKSISFAINEKADYQTSNIKKNLKGTSFSVNNGSKQTVFQINKFGNHHVYSSMIGLIIKTYVNE